jgi:hypothetical protein
MEPTIFSILLGRHAYSVSPEDETAWCRLCLLVGFLFGLLALSGCNYTTEQWCEANYGDWSFKQCCEFCEQDPKHKSWTIERFSDLSVGCFCSDGRAKKIAPRIFETEKQE